MQIVEIARKYVGKKEKPGNTGFIDSEMEKDMKAVGWQNGHSWCEYFIEMIAWRAYPERIQELRGHFVPSAVNSYRNLLRAGYKASLTPEVGSFMFMQRMKDGIAQWQGHCGIVSEVISETKFKSIEGNTNSAGSREGDSVQEKTRQVISNVEDGLKVIGFIKL